MSALGDALAELRPDLEAIADPQRATDAARYMKDRFPFLGVAMTELRSTAKPVVAAGATSSADELLDAVDSLWAEPEREFQYVGVDLLRRWRCLLRAHDLGRVEVWIRTKSWWDTVDAIAAHVVGGLVADHPELAPTMDRWIDDEDRWIARTAILHQLNFRDATDARRLFAYVDARSDDTDFFIRKACGWALRQYARQQPDAVRTYVTDRGDRLSGLTRREALKHL